MSPWHLGNSWHILVWTSRVMVRCWRSGCVSMEVLLTARNMCCDVCWCPRDFEWMRWDIVFKLSMRWALHTNYGRKALALIVFIVDAISRTSRHLICDPLLWNARFCRPLSLQNLKASIWSGKFYKHLKSMLKAHGAVVQQLDGSHGGMCPRFHMP